MPRRKEGKWRRTTGLQRPACKRGARASSLTSDPQLTLPQDFGKDFAHHDSDNDGHHSVKEVADQIAISTVADTMAGHQRADTNKDDNVSLEEYLAVFLGQKGDDKTAAEHEADFKQSDKNGDGVHSVDEVKADAEARAVSHAQEFMKLGDKNGDGKLSLEEYTALHNDL